MNSSTPRIYIAATEQNVGKTTTSVGLHSLLGSVYGRVGFIKPVGQRTRNVEGRPIDEDSVLIRDTFHTASPLEAMSPIAVGPDFTKQHIAGRGNEGLVGRLRDAFDRASWEKDFMLIEGTGHAGVGAVFDLSNARVARILGSKAILIVPGGIGRPLDEAALNHALFAREGVEIIGVIVNKVLPAKIPQLAPVLKKGLEHMGLNLLAVLPKVSMLALPMLIEIQGEISAEMIGGQSGARNRVSHILIGAMSSANLLGQLRHGTLLVVPGDREDILLAALAEANAGTQFSGIVLSDNLLPHSRILKLIQESHLPLLQCELDAYSVASAIHSLTVKTLPGDSQKIGAIQRMFAEFFDLPGFLEKMGL